MMSDAGQSIMEGLQDALRFAEEQEELREELRDWIDYAEARLELAGRQRSWRLKLIHVSNAVKSLQEAEKILPRIA